MDGGRNKYLLIAVLCSFTLIVFSFIPWNSESDDVMIGYPSEIKETGSGFVFEFSTDDGNSIHCFSKTRIEPYLIYEVSGSYSNDKSIFFVTSITLCQTQ